MRSLWIIATFAFVSASHAQSELPAPDQKFKPVFAADQPLVTIDSLGYEFSEFQSLAKIQTLEAQLQQKKNEWEHNLKLHRQVLQLAQKGAAPTTALHKSQEVVQLSESEVTSVSGELREAKAQLELDRLNLLHEGNREIDMRHEIAEQYKNVLETRLQTLAAHKLSAEASRDYHKDRLEQGRSICERGTLSENECTQRQLAFENAVLRVQMVADQTKAMEQSLAGLKRTLRRLLTTKAH